MEDCFTCFIDVILTMPKSMIYCKFSSPVLVNNKYLSLFHTDIRFVTDKLRPGQQKVKISIKYKSKTC